jgi:hypothetical protein
LFCFDKGLTSLRFVFLFSGLSALLEEMKLTRRRDEEAREEQRRRDEEAREEQRRRDEEAREEQRRRDEEAQKKLDEMLQLQHEASSVSFEFSDATKGNKYGPSLFDSIGVKVETVSRADDTAAGFEGDLSTFDWSRGEETCTDDAVKRLHQLLDAVGGLSHGCADWIGAGQTAEFSNVCKFKLPPIRGDRLVASGSTDAIIELQPVGASDARFRFTAGFVEFKTDKANLKPFQNNLELLSGARASLGFEQGVALLATDLVSKFDVLHFSSRNKIMVESFARGPPALKRYYCAVSLVSLQSLIRVCTCLHRFRELLLCTLKRKRANDVLTSIPEHPHALGILDDEQNLTGFEGQVDVHCPMDGLRRVRLIADQFRDYYGADVEVPTFMFQSCSSVNDPPPGMFA